MGNGAVQRSVCVVAEHGGLHGQGPAGVQTLTLNEDNGGWNINYFTCQ